MTRKKGHLAVDVVNADNMSQQFVICLHFNCVTLPVLARTLYVACRGPGEESDLLEA